MNELKKFGFIAPKITDDHYVLGGAFSLPKLVIQEDGQWDNWLPLYEPQFNSNFDSSGCAVWGTENVLEILDRKINNKQSNYSERFIYILAGVRPPGSNPHDIAECIRKNGVIDDDLLPFTATFDEFLQPDPMTPKLLVAGQNWRNGAEFGHEWVWQSSQSKEKRTELIKESLKYSPLGVSVTAWFEENGVYVDKEMDNTHWCVCFGWNEKGWKIFDSYDSSIKILSYDHNIQFCKRYYLQQKQVKKNWLQEILSNLWGFFLDIINPDRLRTGGLARSSDWGRIQKEHLKNNPLCIIGGEKGTLLNPLNVHHIVPFHVDMTKEKDPNNLATLCRRHHFEWGHLNSWRSWNKNVTIDSKIWREKIKNRP